MNHKQFILAYVRLTIVASAIAVSFIMSGAVFSQTPPVGFVNIPKIMEDSPQAKAAQKRLQNEFSDTRDELNACREGVGRLDNKLRSEGKDMDTDRRERMIETITRKQRECSEIQNDLQSKFNKRRSEELNQLQKLISQVIRQIAESKAIDLIVGPPAVLYKSEQIDLTEAVLKALEPDQKLQ